MEFFFFNLLDADVQKLLLVDALKYKNDTLICKTVFSKSLRKIQQLRIGFLCLCFNVEISVLCK